MSTRYSKVATDSNSLPTGYEGDNVPEDLTIPPCTIEDVDRALFVLFNEELPLYYVYKRQSTRIPVIFATGERFAVLRRRRPLRDRAGALILPLVSIIRSGIDQATPRGMTGGQNGPMIIKKKLGAQDPRYQLVVNKLGLDNQDDMASKDHRTAKNNVGVAANAKPGVLASRRSPGPSDENARTGRLLAPDLGQNIYEITTVPPIKYYQANYEITFWSQYTQQMNDMLSAVMTSYQNNPGRSFRIETKSGYWFCAYLEAAFTPANNFDDFSDDERLVRYSFTVNVPAYMVAPEFPGALPALRKFISAPDISFDVTQTGTSPMTALPSAVIKSPDPGSFALENLMTVDDMVPGQAIGASPVANSMAAIGEIISGHAQGHPRRILPNIGGYQGATNNTCLTQVMTDPFSGKQKEVCVTIRGRDQRKGETIYRGGIVLDLGDFDAC